MSTAAVRQSLISARAAIEAALAMLDAQTAAPAPPVAPTTLGAAPVAKGCQHPAHLRQALGGFGGGSNEWRCKCGATGAGQ